MRCPGVRPLYLHLLCLENMRCPLCQDEPGQRQLGRCWSCLGRTPSRSYWYCWECAALLARCQVCGQDMQPPESYRPLLLQQREERREAVTPSPILLQAVEEMYHSALRATPRAYTGTPTWTVATSLPYWWRRCCCLVFVLAFPLQ